MKLLKVLFIVLFLCKSVFAYDLKTENKYSFSKNSEEYYFNVDVIFVNGEFDKIILLCRPICGVWVDDMDYYYIWEEWQVSYIQECLDKAKKLESREKQ